MKCRFCQKPLKYIFISLVSSPLANSYLTEEDLHKAESFYPLEVYVCDRCFLVQLLEYETREHIFTEYAYFSSFSTSWLDHAKKYTEYMIKQFSLDSNSHVVEIASNDGYLLQYFIEKGIPVLGIEPAENVAEVAKQKGIPTDVMFFGAQVAKQLVSQGKSADLLVGNNVLAHVPELNDFVTGLKIFLKPKGVITMEFPHLMRLINYNQFDTIYHEHFSYFSFLTVKKVFSKHELNIFNVEELPTHGGSLRIYAKHEDDKTKSISDKVYELEQREKEAGYTDINQYLTFGEKVKSIKRELLNFLIQMKNDGKTIVGYGAPAKGNTLLNYCGIRTDFIDYTVDRSPYKQGRYLPGTHIPVRSPDNIKKTKPDYLFILPWNIKDEIISQNEYIREWDGRFIIPIPKLQVI